MNKLLLHDVTKLKMLVAGKSNKRKKIVSNDK